LSYRGTLDFQASDNTRFGRRIKDKLGCGASSRALLPCRVCGVAPAFLPFYGPIAWRRGLRAGRLLLFCRLGVSFRFRCEKTRFKLN